MAKVKADEGQRPPCPYKLEFNTGKQEYCVYKDGVVVKSFGNHFYSEEDAVRFMERSLDENK